MAALNFKQTKVYQKAFEQAMNVFELSKGFPTDEKYSLTDQVRRASRSVCANLAEAYRKKVYPAHFLLSLPIVMLKILRLMFGLTLLLRASIC